MPGAGTSSTTNNTTTNQASNSQTAPWAPAQPDLTADLTNAGALSGYGTVNPNSQNMWIGAAPKTGTRFNNAARGSAMGAAEALPNPSTAASNIGQSFETGDPTGLLASGQKSYAADVAPIANQSMDPTKDPGVAALMASIQDQINSNQNAEFAGAGRSLSGMNSKADATAFTNAMAPYLLGQYNTNQTNIMNASQGLLGANQSTQALMNANKQAGVQLASSAFPLSQLPAQTIQSAINQPAVNAGQMTGMAENLTVPIAGLG